MIESSPEQQNIKFKATDSTGEVSAILDRPVDAVALLILAHGAGAGMRHTFMESLAGELGKTGIATLRYQFPYMEAGRKPPNPLPILVQTVCSAVKAGEKVARGLPLFAGGKSLGGRMTSTAASQDKLPDVTGIVFFGFPLHAPGKPSNDRAAHLYEVSQPMLFLQGTRDKLADLDLLKPVCEKVADRGHLHTIQDADHSFHVPKRSGRTDREIITELAMVTKDWIGHFVA